MSWQVTPQIIIDGEPIDCTPDALDYRPVAVDGLKIVWGRGDLEEQSSPSSMTVTLIDTTETWSRRVRTKNVIGSIIEVVWTGQSDGMHDKNLVGRVFYGRIKKAHARPDYTSPLGVRGWRITLTCADAMADLGYVPAAPDGVVAESMHRFVSRMRAWGKELGIIRDVPDPDFIDTSYDVRVNMKDKTALEVFTDFYIGVGYLPWSFQHDTAEVVGVPHHEFSGRVGFVAGDTDPKGAVRIAPLGEDMRTLAAVSGCQAIGEPDVSVDMVSQIKKVEVTTYRYVSSDERRKSLWLTYDTVPVGRTVTWNSNIVGLWQNDVESRLYDITYELNLQELPTHIPFETAPTFHFDSIGQINLLLSTWEQSGLFFFLSGDLAHGWTFGRFPDDRPPILSVIGGTLRYDPQKGWSHTLTPIYPRINMRDHTPLTWRQLMQQAHTGTSTRPYWKPYSAPKKEYDRVKERDIYWGAPDGEKYRFDPSITWGDLAYIDKHDGKDIIDLKGETR